MMCIDSRPVRVVIAEHSLELRQSLVTLVEVIDDFELVGAAATGAEALALCRCGSPDVIISGLLLPDMDPNTAMLELGPGVAGAQLIALLGFQQDIDEPVLKRTVFEHFEMDVTADQLIDSIRRAGRRPHLKGT